MSELITTLGAGVLAVPYVAGSGTMTVTPSTWPDGLAFPGSGIFSVSLKTGSGPKYPVYTVASFAMSGGNLVFAVTLEAGTDTAAAAGSVVSEVLTARSLSALISEGGGGGGSVYHYQYVFGGVLLNGTADQLSAMSASGVSNLIANPPIVGGAAGPGMCTLGAGGSSVMFPFQLPASWDGSAITLDVDVVYDILTTAGTITLEAFSTDVTAGGNGNVVVWSSAGGSVSQAASSTVYQNFPPLRFHLIVPLAGLAAGDFVYFSIGRPAGDTFAANAYVIGALLGIKY